MRVSKDWGCDRRGEKRRAERSMVSREWIYSEIGIRDRKKHDKTKETKLS